MRGTGYYGTTEGQRTIDRYAIAGTVDGVLTLSVVEGVNLDAPNAALKAYRRITNREDDINLFVGQLDRLEDETDGWYRFQVRDPLAGPQNIAVFYIGSRRV